jgi:hypothetical protein
MKPITGVRKFRTSFRFLTEIDGIAAARRLISGTRNRWGLSFCHYISVSMTENTRRDKGFRFNFIQCICGILRFISGRQNLSSGALPEGISDPCRATASRPRDHPLHRRSVLR